ncbi:MAG TPA: hypothetical protein VMV18_05590 [bacterium]|nr:hypothetical protein [bacterium]
MSISHIQTLKASPANGNGSVTLVSVAVGDLIVVTGISNVAGDMTAPSDGSNTYHPACPEKADSGNGGVSHWYTVATTGGNLTVTLNGTSPYTTIIASTYRSTAGWPAGTGAYDQHASGNGSGNTSANAVTSGATGTRAQASELIVGSCSTLSTSTCTFTAGTNFTIPTNGKEENGASNMTGATEYQTVAAVGTDAATFTEGASDDWACIVSTFMENTGPAPSPLLPQPVIRPAFFRPGLAR